MNLSRGSWGTIRTDKQLKLQVHVTGARRKEGYVIYDVNGNVSRVKGAVNQSPPSHY
jgi:hypothetical protein